MCLLFFYSLFLFTLFIQAFSLSFLALFFHLLPLPTSYLHFLYPPRSGTHC